MRRSLYVDVRLSEMEVTLMLNYTEWKRNLARKLAESMESTFTRDAPRHAEIHNP